MLEKLEHNSGLAIATCETNHMKLKTDKCHLLISSSKHEHRRAKIGQNIVRESNTVNNWQIPHNS